MWWIYLIIYFIGAWASWFIFGKFNMIGQNDEPTGFIIASVVWPVFLSLCMLILPGYILYQYGKNPNKNPFKEL